jgi:hypothetical protein
MSHLPPTPQRRRQRRRPTRRPRRRLLRVLGPVLATVVAGALLAMALLTVLRGDGSPDPEQADASGDATDSPTRPGRSTGAKAPDLTGVTVARGPFCDAIDPDVVRAALDGPVARTNHYDSGDVARISPGVKDVAHEYNCSYVGDDRTQARAWVFAPPTTRREAKRLVRRAVGRSGCTKAADAPDFGSPGAVTRCSQEKPPAVAVTYQGLFGDGWLTCRLTAPAREGLDTDRLTRQVERRARAWCVDLVGLVGSRP